VLVVLADSDLTTQELASELSTEPSADEVHRTIRQFRRTQSARFALESLLGESAGMQKVRAQVAAAAASWASVLVCGHPGTGRGHIARAIHYRAAGESEARLVAIECELVNEDLLRRALNAVGSGEGALRHRSTLVLENLDRLAEAHQARLLDAVRRNEIVARIIATYSGNKPCLATEAFNDAPPLAADASAAAVRATQTAPHTDLVDLISTITIHVPRLCQRLEDLPILAQFFLEVENRDRGKQIGSLRNDALDLLALHSWPGELDELREVIAAAHRAASTHEITPVDLPPIIHHASKAAHRARREPQRIVLDELLAEIEKEAIVRALAQVRGNKTEAADLLGMTRPRLYRRLVQLGLAGPEFIERQPDDEGQ
jgi:DNA-binding NtrC family response regulator